MHKRQREARHPATTRIFSLLILFMVPCKREDGFCRTFCFSRREKNQEKPKLIRIVVLANLCKRTQVVIELFFFHIELCAANTNPQHPHTLFGNCGIKFFRKILYNTRKFPMKVLRLTAGRPCPFSVCCFKSYSRVLAFGIFTGISTALK